MRQRRSSSSHLHRELLDDPDRLLALYDQSAQGLIDTVRPEGYFDGWDPDDLRWPPSRTENGPIDAEGLEKRARLVDTVYRGVPPLRDERLGEAYDRFRKVSAAYHEGNLFYLRARREFVAKGRGSEEDFLRLYQSLSIKALVREELHTPDVGEASLERLHLARVPLSHAQAVAVALPSVEVDDDPRWEHCYAVAPPGSSEPATLREVLTDVAGRTLDYIAAGELLATRFNTYNNFGLFGSSVWKVSVDAHRLAHRLREEGGADPAELDRLEADLRRAQGMVIEFLRAHTEDPARLKPEGYWYGSDYSYLTRDMIDLGRAILERANRLVDADRRAGHSRLEVPPLLEGTARGRFLPHRHLGKREELPSWRRTLRLGRWVLASWKLGRGKKGLVRSETHEGTRRSRAWKQWLEWSETSLRIFDVRVDVTVDPLFHTIARELDLAGGGRKILFLPTHQSLLDHPVMYHVLSSPELQKALGWSEPVPCAILARTGMAMAGVKMGPWSWSMFGLASDEFDRLLESVDGYVTLERSGATGPTTSKIAAALGDRPGVIYPMATTAAFDSQVFPLQHALFAQLPPDVVIIPIALRGIHSVWPKCPRGNRNINPGRVEAVVSPPLLGETILLPRRRSLRIQLEAAALLQTIHITTLLDPDLPEA